MMYMLCQAVLHALSGGAYRESCAESFVHIHSTRGYGTVVADRGTRKLRENSTGAVRTVADSEHLHTRPRTRTFSITNRTNCNMPLQLLAKL
ncbi:hypothetical protein C2E23DRAFT_894690 [Lenzites betulinus]|nr:hypothetical protein C2E23DRAFT_894690 [Lenzites betulinus]